MFKKLIFILFILGFQSCKKSENKNLNLSKNNYPILEKGFKIYVFYLASMFLNLLINQTMSRK